MNDKIKPISTLQINYSSDLYKIVDCLNRTLKHDNLIFGLALDKENDEKAIFTIYRA